MTQTPAPESDPPTADAQWLVHCSPERTLVARRRGADTVLVKLFEQGSLLEAQQETDLALTLSGPGVVAYRTAEMDPVTNKPCVTMDYCEGEDLERLVARSGPLPATAAAGLMARLAEVLLDFHATARPQGPFGVVHRDVKPANIQLTGDPEPRIVLMDLEHVIPRRAGDGDGSRNPGFTGGTHGYSPPESYDGAFPHPGFDVFGLGATLFFLLCGCPAFGADPQIAIDRARRGAPRLGRLAGQPAALRKLVADCLAVRRQARPPMSAVRERLAAFAAAASAADRLQDEALRAVHAADFATANRFRTEAVGDPGHDRERQGTLQRLAANRRRLLQRLGGPPADPVPDLGDGSDLRAVGLAVAVGLRRSNAFLERFPLHPEVLAARRDTARVGRELLEQVLPAVAAAKMAGEFDTAGGLLDAAAAVVDAIARIPGGFSGSAANPGLLPGPLLRDPKRLLERARRDVEGIRAAHDGLIARLEAAEAQLDVAQAGVVVDEITAIYGGASNVVAPLKDRLLRLDFYLQRIAWPRRILGQLEELLELQGAPHRLDVVLAFCEHCGARAISGASTAHGKGGVRALLETMHQLTEDFPHAAPAMAEPESALSEAMRHATEEAWRHLAEAKEKLGVVPVPIRPVQNLLNRLDRIRMLEAFLDLPDRSRERLQDGIERVRIRLDQARTARDNLARGAEEAMERGHLTTALFDMARAVDEFEDDADPEGATNGSQLSERLEEARRRKQEREQAIVENHRLAARYVELQEDESSTVADRLAVLQDRAACLDTLTRTIGPDKGAHYATDLRDVMVHLMQEKAEQGERQLDRTTEPSIRLQIVQETQRDLRETLAGSALANEAGGRIRRILDHWQSREREIRDLLLSQSRSTVQGGRGRRRSPLVWVGAAAVLAVSIFTTVQIVHGRTTKAPPLRFVKPPVRLEKEGDRITFEGVRGALLTLSRFATDLRDADLAERRMALDLPLAALAEKLVVDLAGIEDRQAPPDMGSLDELELDLAEYDRALVELDGRLHGADSSWHRFFRVARDFGRSAHLIGLSLVVWRGGDLEELRRRRERTPLVHIPVGSREFDYLAWVSGRRP